MTTPVTQRCSIANSLDVLGQKWSLLIVREAFVGRTRFSEFRESLGVAADVLTDRLARLVDAGVLERRTYREEGSRERAEYVLTPAGLALAPVLAAFVEWGDVHRASGFGPAVRYVETGSAEPVSLVFATASGRLVPLEQVQLVAGPGALTA